MVLPSSRRWHAVVLLAVQQAAGGALADAAHDVEPLTMEAASAGKIHPSNIRVVVVQTPGVGRAPVWILGIAVLVGGWFGAEYGSRRFANPVVRRILAVVLALAGAKMVFA